VQNETNYPSISSSFSIGSSFRWHFSSEEKIQRLVGEQNVMRHENSGIHNKTNAIYYSDQAVRKNPRESEPSKKHSDIIIQDRRLIQYSP